MFLYASNNLPQQKPRRKATGFLLAKQDGFGTVLCRGLAEIVPVA